MEVAGMEKFMEDLKSDPSHAMTWADSMFKNVVIAELESEFKDIPEEVRGYRILDYLMREASGLNSTSTSTSSNMMARLRVSVLSDMYRNTIAYREIRRMEDEQWEAIREQEAIRVG